MKILVACEESQRVCIAFRNKGHEAYSCDLQECSGDHPEWHIWGNCFNVMNTPCEFYTQNGEYHMIDKWDMLIAHPPCTHLAVSGVAWFEKKRSDGRQREGIELFCSFLESDIPKVVIENPVGIISGDYIKKWFPDLCEKYGLPRNPSQTIHPWQFGDNHEKTTHLWLKGVPALVPNVKDKPNLEYKEWIDRKTGKIKRQPKWYADAFKLPPDERAKVRSKTFEGIALAMAEQWG